MLSLGLLALFNPVVIEEERDPIDDVVLLVTDRSPSQAIGDRPATDRRSVDQSFANA